MKYKWELHPEYDYRGDGVTVAKGYYLIGKEELLIFVVRSFSKFYRVEKYKIPKQIFQIPYSDVELSRFKRKIIKKEKKGILTSAQVDKLMLQKLCEIIEKRFDS